MHLDSRKRPHIDDEDDIPSNKKRATVSANGTPQPNGVADDELSLDNLELFRKEAIFRRMRHYSRENERSQTRIAELEHRKNTCEAGYAAIVACWSQLIETIHLLVKPEDLPQVNFNTEELFDLARHLPEHSSENLIAALEDKVNATRTLVSSFVRLGEQSPFRLFDNNDYLEAQKTATTVAALRSEVAHLSSQLQETRNERETYHKKLLLAENRYERAHSKTVQALEARKAKSAQRDGTEELQQKPSSPSHSSTPSPTPVNGVHDMYDATVLEQQIKHRENKIVELEKQVASYHDRCMILEAEMRLKESGENVFESNAYKDVVSFALKLDADVGEKYKQTMVLEDEVARLTANMERHDEELLAGTTKQLQELQTMLQKRDADNARLREQRDQQNAELLERRHKDSVKTASFEQLKLLAESRAERISQLELEINQCKAHLAAHTGDKQLLLTYLHGDDQARERFQIVQEQLKQAEFRVTALEQTISSYGGDMQKHAEYQAASYQKILELTEELETHRALIGSSSPELSDLMRVLREKEEEAEKLRLLEMQRGEAEKSLYSELEKLSCAWEALDRQVKSKVFDLSAMEERLSKNAMDKAKAENKYYAAMRDKEAMEIEKKSFMRMLEKQGKAVEKLVDTEGSLQAQINLLEKEIATQKKIIESMKETHRVQEKSLAELYSRVEVDKHRTEHLRNACKSVQQEHEAKRTELRQLEDELIRSKRDLERQMARAKETATTTAESSEAENLKTILKCSTCRINFRSTVITKCMHTFCKDCVDKRIQTRQRKCPACNVSFAQSEVQQIWFQ